MASLVTYLLWEELQPFYKPLSFWNRGIISLVDWSELFSDAAWFMSIFENYFSATYITRQVNAIDQLFAEI